ncbi:hypothetical protein DY000_02023743 [Brassica cretica]|uniref:Helitron helicase-like domain-containing protein n=1 Tax=Brassica cretica TaxID=69181 RepID=A0ABQ7EGM5_BRACR|nr:hypothetical protein DY000_02023743 [Brassica cretica]
MLDQCNPQVKAFRSTRDRFHVEGSTGYRMRLIVDNLMDGPIIFRLQMNVFASAISSVTMREFFAFRILERKGEAPTITRSGRLFHQFLVDAYTMIESSRLRYLWLNQKKLRSDSYDAIQKAAARGGVKMAEQGRRIYIPTTFTGGKRYIKQHYYDAMALCMINQARNRRQNNECCLQTSFSEYSIVNCT